MSTAIAPGPQTLTPEQLGQFNRDGYVIVRGLFSSEEVAHIRETFMEMGKDGPVEGLSEFRHSGTKQEYDPADPLKFYPRMMHPHKHGELPVGPLAMRYMLDPRVGAILEDLFGGIEPVATQSMFYFKPPGARGQDLHQDNYYLRVKPGTCMAAWTAVDDSDEDNGGLMVVPGTAHLEIACPKRADNTMFFTADHVDPPPGLSPINLTLKAGDVLFFNGSVIHGSWPNRSKDRFRRSFICHYVPADSAETHSGYRPFFKFDQSEITIGDAIGGGPCGEFVEAPKEPH
jgi:phytanoyl-CoA hydroxylase